MQRQKQKSIDLPFFDRFYFLRNLTDETTSNLFALFNDVHVFVSLQKLVRTRYVLGEEFSKFRIVFRVDHHSRRTRDTGQQSARRVKQKPRSEKQRRNMSFRLSVGWLSYGPVVTWVSLRWPSCSRLAGCVPLIDNW